MKRSECNLSNYQSPDIVSPPRSRQRLSTKSDFNEIYNQICVLEQKFFPRTEGNSHNNDHENLAVEAGFQNDQFENEEENREYDGTPLNFSILTPESSPTGEHDIEEYEEEMEEEEELDEELYNDHRTNEETIYCSLTSSVLYEHELAALEYNAMGGEWQNKLLNDQKRYNDPKADIPYDIHRAQKHSDDANIQNLSFDGNEPTTSRRARALLASLRKTPWMHQPNYQPSEAARMALVSNTNMFKQPDLIEEYQKLLMQTYYLTKTID